MPAPNFTTIWEFQVKVELCSQFEKIYGPQGDWVQLFRRHPGYKGSVLLCDADHPGRYLTLDHWDSRESLHQFKRDHQAEYEALDKRCEHLTEREISVGSFQSLGAPS